MAGIGVLDGAKLYNRQRGNQRARDFAQTLPAPVPTVTQPLLEKPPYSWWFWSTIQYTALAGGLSYLAALTLQGANPIPYSCEGIGSAAALVTFTSVVILRNWLEVRWVDNYIDLKKLYAEYVTRERPVPEMDYRNGNLFYKNEDGLTVMKKPTAKERKQFETQAANRIYGGRLILKEQNEKYLFDYSLGVWIFAKNWPDIQNTALRHWVKGMGGPDIFKPQEYYAVRDYLVGTPLAQWKNERAQKTGWELTERGKLVINGLARTATPPPVQTVVIAPA